MGESDRTPYTPPQVEQRTPKPPGILPKNAQALLIGGLALVMVVVIAFSGRNTPKERVTPPAPGASVVDPNDERIRDYRRRIEEQAQKLALEQARWTQTQQALGAPSGVGPVPPSME